MSDARSDVTYQHLLDMARDKTVAGRQALVAAVADLFCDDDQLLTDREKALMSDILRQIIHDVEMSVRRNLADKLSAIDDAPHELMVALANDDIEVAHPILIASDMLHDTDLVEIVQHRTMQHQLAISMRKSLSESVTDALVESGNEDVIKVMLENPDARVSKTTMEYLVEQSKRVDTYQNPLLKRPDLGPELAKRMYWWVSAALREHIVDNFDVDPTELDATLETTVKDVMSREINVSQPASKPLELAERLAEEGKITSDLMLRVLRQGEVPLFEALFGKQTGLRDTLVRRILFEPGGEALAVASKAIGIPKSDFASVFMLTRKARSTDRVINPRELTRVLELFDRVKEDAAAKMISRWQRDADYLNAVRELTEDRTEDPDGDGVNDRRNAGERRTDPDRRDT
jgi:uncharacterized protein (DUF2336 family)